MKKIYSFILLLFICASASAQLYYTNMDITDVCFANASVGYSCAQTGAVRKTTDGGQTWQLLNPRAYSNLTKVYFISATTGFIGGENGTLKKTTDGGLTWQDSPFDGSGSGLASVADIYFLNSTTGFMLCGNLYKTTDGGASWNAVIGNGLYSGGVQMWVVSETVILISYGPSNGIVRSTDGGLTWNSASSGDGMAFSGQTGFTYSTYQYHFTTNGGTNWTTVNGAAHSFRSVTLYDAQNGMGVDTSGTIYKTADGGHSWTLSTTGHGFNLNKVAMSSLNNAIAVGDLATIMVTGNGGTNWTTVSKSSNNYNNRYNYGIQWVDNNVVYVVGDQGKIIKSTDGGATWNDFTFSAYGVYTSNGLFFLNKDTGYVVNANHIFKTTNGGQTWKNDSIGGIYDELAKICFVNADTGVAVGSNGLIARTTDGGNTWNKIVIPSFNTSMSDIKFVNDSVGFIPINGGMMKTTDAGATWANINVPADQNAYIDFPTKDTGYCTGYHFYQTVDGGTTWHQIVNGYGGCASNSVKFVNGKIGYAANCTVYAADLSRTMDGGITWANNFKWDRFSTAFSGVATSPDGKRFIVMCEDGGVLASGDTSTATTVGIAEAEAGSKNAVKVMPNPFAEFTYISFGSALHDGTISIFNTMGQLIKYIPDIHGESATIYKEHLSPGLYLYRVTDKEKMIGTGKLLVE